MRKLPLLVLAALSLPACAQVFNMERDRIPLARLDGPMRFHTGDDSRWSELGFDDSAWPLISSESTWSAQGYKDYGGFAWYRFKVILPTEHARLGLYIPGIMTSYQVFADGKRLGSFGGFPPHAIIYDLHPQLLLLPQDSAGEMEFAIRVWHWPHWSMFYGGGFSAPPQIGDVDQLKHWMTLQDRDTFWALTAQNISALLNLLYCVAGFALLLMRPKERLYLWYALAGLCFFLQPLLDDYGEFHDLPQFGIDGLTNGFTTAGFFSFLVFVWLMTARRNKIWIWIGVAYLALNAMMWTVPALLNLPVSVGNMILTGANVVLTTSPFIMLFQASRRGDPDARVLLIPVGLNTLANWINGTLWVIVTAGYSWIEPYWTFWKRTFTWPFPFGLYDLSIWILLLAILGIVVLRFARSRHEEEQLKSEFESARAVQQLLIPEVAPQVPGFRIESAYRPARHVGGDFFYVHPEGQDGILLVIGDVSGKGLRAALTVNLVIGALRTMPALAPARILAALNRGLVGQMGGGFVTCCIARIAPDGTATIANAGHLSPYLAGAELPLAAGLPLGLLAGAEYEESHFQLQPGQPLTFLSDGVLEATNPQGELYGFDRTQAISTESAEKVAQAAQAFGQEDDITVLTLTFSPAEVTHA